MNPFVLPATNPIPSDIIELSKSAIVKRVCLHTGQEKAVVMLTALYALEVGEDFDLDKFSRFIEVDHQFISAILGSLYAYSGLNMEGVQ